MGNGWIFWFQWRATLKMIPTCNGNVQEACIHTCVWNTHKLALTQSDHIRSHTSSTASVYSALYILDSHITLVQIETQENVTNWKRVSKQAHNLEVWYWAPYSFFSGWCMCKRQENVLFGWEWNQEKFVWAFAGTAVLVRNIGIWFFS